MIVVRLYYCCNHIHLSTRTELPFIELVDMDTSHLWLVLLRTPHPEIAGRYLPSLSRSFCSFNSFRRSLIILEISVWPARFASPSGAVRTHFLSL